ncbi:short-chain dehydrogenase/reductase [Rhodococcoides trifolii]|uniref:Short-chain dehydrogenase/reductase n=1 Tax=Rhodococcoides trifolii TaxID=908250 RepID=A0A917G5U5_9NOCA|nr:SDR family NAD(P)-dependent oxidoreductase [Rhodococcus trifolii]GGG24388.1 short-chain dehydrogenase/reductase [Rhodococcus trifolii]
MADSNKTWFITGSSKGFGNLWARAALERGDRVAATARNTADLASLATEYGTRVLTLQLDVTDRDAVFATVRQAAEHFGTIDVLVNNAGYGHFGMVEELTEAEIRSQMETNFFGAVWVTQAVLPIMRAQGSGRILQITSEGGVRAYPGIGAYHASKWALEGLSESLWQEVEQFGIRVTNVEPGPYDTDWLATGSRVSPGNPAYDDVRASTADGFDVGDAAATTNAILEIVDTDDAPHRVFLGKTYDAIVPIYQDRLDTWRRWQPTALAAFGRAGG